MSMKQQTLAMEAIVPWSALCAAKAFKCGASWLLRSQVWDPAGSEAIKRMVISSSGVIHSIRRRNYVYFTEAVYAQPPVLMRQPVARLLSGPIDTDRTYRTYRTTKVHIVSCVNFLSIRLSGMNQMHATAPTSSPDSQGKPNNANGIAST